MEDSASRMLQPRRWSRKCHGNGNFVERRRRRRFLYAEGLGPSGRLENIHRRAPPRAQCPCGPRRCDRSTPSAPLASFRSPHRHVTNADARANRRPAGNHFGRTADRFFSAARKFIAPQFLSWSACRGPCRADKERLQLRGQARCRVARCWPSFG